MRMGKKKEVSESERANILNGRNYKKSNDIINAKGRSSLLVQKLIAVSIQQAEVDEKGILSAVLYGTDLKKIFGVTGNNFYKTVQNAIEPEPGKPSILD